MQSARDVDTMPPAMCARRSQPYNPRKARGPRPGPDVGETASEAPAAGRAGAMSVSLLIAQVKAFELLTVEAAVTGDRNAAYQALLAHPLGPEADQVQTVMDDLLETNKAFLPRFWD